MGEQQKLVVIFNLPRKTNLNKKILKLCDQDISNDRTCNLPVYKLTIKIYTFESLVVIERCIN